VTPAKLGGVLPVLSTPFDAGDDIDEQTLAKEIDWLITSGVDGLTIGMVSEVLRLSERERRHLTTVVLALTAGRVPVVASVGAESTRAALALVEHAQQAGAAALMAILPLGVTLTHVEILAYYRTLLDHADVPLIVQDASAYLGPPLCLNLYVELLADYGPHRVLFKPEATPIGPRLSALRDATDGAAAVFEGTGGIALIDSHRRGIIGTMPGPEVAWAILALWRALEQDDWQMAQAVHGPLTALICMQTSLDAFIAVEKYLLLRQGVFVNERRRHPYGYELDRETILEADRLIALLATSCRIQLP
jgi:dihydrodipicolinate synthase/N-acetylneuraminate lyase